ncbi:hypothetical protein V6N13_098596 [Hibiscus sabdariffa]|uniref:Uncharacterized protein n=1 Tax=Hibiscus sabdariffa TaxID=183260 RepID=A0ABR2EEB6_9ROSI
MLKLGLPESELSGEAAGKLDILLTGSDDESEFSNECLVEEEKLEEIMQELYKEITNSSYSTTSQQQQPMVTQPSSPLHLSSLPFFCGCDVKGESCGASMSHLSSTLMVGVSFMGPAGKLPGVKVGTGSQEKEKRWPENELWAMEMDDSSTSNNMVGGEEMEGCDEISDEWLARVLGWGPMELMWGGGGMIF